MCVGGRSGGGGGGGGKCALNRKEGHRGGEEREGR